MNALRMALELARAQDHEWAKAFVDGGLKVERISQMSPDKARALIAKKTRALAESGVMSPEWVDGEIVYMGNDVSWRVGDTAVISMWRGVREAVGCRVGEEVEVWADEPSLKEVEVLMDLAHAARRAFTSTPWIGMDAFGPVRAAAFQREASRMAARVRLLRSEAALLAESWGRVVGGSAWGLEAFLAWADQSKAAVP